MKKIILGLGLIIAAISFTHAQNDIGITGGYLNVKNDGADEGAGGFYAGIFADMEMSRSFHFQPALLYGNVEDQNLLYLPAMLKYYVAHSDLNVQLGPQVNYLLDGEGDFTDNLGLDLNVGVAYDLFHNIFIELKYGFRIAKKSETFAGPDMNTLMVGLGISI